MRLGSNQAPACPWFHRFTDTLIECDGLTDGTTITYTGTEDDIKLHLKTYCCANYECCELYIAIAQQYPDLVMDKPTLVRVANDIADNNQLLHRVLTNQEKTLHTLIGLTEDEKENE